MLKRFSASHILGLFTQDVINDIQAHDYEPFAIAEDIEVWANNPYTDVKMDFMDRGIMHRFDNRMKFVEMVYIDDVNGNLKIVNLKFHADNGYTYAKIPPEFGLTLGKSC